MEIEHSAFSSKNIQLPPPALKDVESKTDDLREKVLKNRCPNCQASGQRNYTKGHYFCPRFITQAPKEPSKEFSLKLQQFADRALQNIDRPKSIVRTFWRAASSGKDEANFINNLISIINENKRTKKIDLISALLMIANVLISDSKYKTCLTRALEYCKKQLFTLKKNELIFTNTFNEIQTTIKKLSSKLSQPKQPPKTFAELKEEILYLLERSKLSSYLLAYEKDLKKRAEPIFKEFSMKKPTFFIRNPLWFEEIKSFSQLPLSATIAISDLIKSAERLSPEYPDVLRQNLEICCDLLETISDYDKEFKESSEKIIKTTINLRPISSKPYYRFQHIIAKRRELQALPRIANNLVPGPLVTYREALK